MNLLIDAAGVGAFRPTTQNDGRYYYCAKPARMAILRIDGTDLASISGLVVDAQVGWDIGTPGFVRPANENQRHTKITVRRILRGVPHETTLTAILRAAPTEVEGPPLA